MLSALRPATGRRNFFYIAMSDESQRSSIGKSPRPVDGFLFNLLLMLNLVEKIQIMAYAIER